MYAKRRTILHYEWSLFEEAQDNLDRAKEILVNLCTKRTCHWHSLSLVPLELTRLHLSASIAVDPLHVEMAIKLSNFYCRTGQHDCAAQALESVLARLQKRLDDAHALETRDGDTAANSEMDKAHEQQEQRVRVACLVVVQLARILAIGTVPHLDAMLVCLCFAIDTHTLHWLHVHSLAKN